MRQRRALRRPLRGPDRDRPGDLTFDTLAGAIKAEVKDRRVKLLMAGVGDFRMDQTSPWKGKPSWAIS